MSEANSNIQIRGSNWIQTYSGKKFSLMSGEFQLSDLIAGASRECRFAGQIKDTIDLYSVLEHSAGMYDQARRDGLSIDAPGGRKVLRTILAHDLPEGLLRDIVSPFKADYGNYKFFEHDLYRRLAAGYDLFDPLPAYIKSLDDAFCVAEKRALLDTVITWEWEDQVRQIEVTIHGWTPRRARLEWITRWNAVSPIKLKNF